MPIKQCLRTFDIDCVSIHGVPHTKSSRSVDDQKLNWQNHSNCVCSSSFNYYGIFINIEHFMNENIIQNLYFAQECLSGLLTMCSFMHTEDSNFAKCTHKMFSKTFRKLRNFQTTPNERIWSFTINLPETHFSGNHSISVTKCSLQKLFALYSRILKNLIKFQFHSSSVFLYLKGLSDY